jgi:hypothetical protein
LVRATTKEFPSFLNPWLGVARRHPSQLYESVNLSVDGMFFAGVSEGAYGRSAGWWVVLVFIRDSIIFPAHIPFFFPTADPRHAFALRTPFMYVFVVSSAPLTL